ncbi:hypothetical protein WCX18_03360 [Sulfurimonas sp. HSL1-2]|uniref:hypothetical protein n=1 Tax=Thiomicrolovo zhangzhouensis TaxID=3131933 RepID=UPI0031F869DD
MKTKLLLLMLPLFAFAQDVQPDMQWVDQEIAAIKPPRQGVSSAALFGLQDPFRAQLILNQPPQAKKGTTAYVQRYAPKPPLTLESVINSHTALIDGKWYKQNDTIYGYAIVKIERDSVLLQKKKKQITLTLKKKNPKIQINAK